MKKILLFVLVFSVLLSFVSMAQTCENCNCTCEQDPYLSDTNSWNPLVEARLEQFFQKLDTIENPVAVFDADGTLWSNDLGESFFKWLVENKKLIGVDYSKDLYQEYQDLCDKDVDEGFSSLITIMAGISEDELKEWADEFFQTFDHNVYPKQKELVKKLHDSGVDVWIVSASNRWSIETAVIYLGIEEDHVVAMESEVIDGVITDQMIPPILHGHGKVEGIKKYIGDRVDFVCGNSRSDYEMLDFASEMSLIINPSDKVGTISAEDVAESSLLIEAEENGWAIQKWNW